MKEFIVIVTGIYFLIAASTCQAQSDYLISIEYYNSGIDLFNKGDYTSADSAFTYSLYKCRSTDTYYNRALTRKKLGSMEGFCNDMYMATANGDSLSRMIFINKCTTRDSIFSVDKNSPVKTKIVAKHKYDSNKEIILIDTLGRMSWNSDTDTISPDGTDSTVIMPTFPGNEEALFSFIVKNTTYPPKSSKQKIQGTVYITFTVSQEGKIRNIKISKGVNEELNNEAARVIGKMPQWFPGMQNGKFVNVQLTLPVKFSLKN